MLNKCSNHIAYCWYLLWYDIVCMRACAAWLICQLMLCSTKIVKTDNVTFDRDWSRSKSWLLSMFHDVVTKQLSSGLNMQHQVSGLSLTLSQPSLQLQSSICCICWLLLLPYNVTEVDDSCLFDNSLLIGSGAL